MFTSVESAQEKYNEYLRLSDTIREARASAPKFLKVFMSRDTRAFVNLYKARKRKLYSELKENCFRCLGTGAPFALQGDDQLYDESCPNCFRYNNNPR